MLASLCPKSNPDRPVRPTSPRPEVDFSEYRSTAPEAVTGMIERIGQAIILALASFGPVSVWSILKIFGVV